MFWSTASNEMAGMEALVALYTQPESEVVDALLADLNCLTVNQQRIHDDAAQLIAVTREEESAKTGIASLVQHYDLTTEEGVLLMCVAEALLRIPDSETEKLLIADKLSGANWEKHLGVSESRFVNLSTWGLSVTGKLLSTDDTAGRFRSIWKRMVKKSSEGVILQAVRHTIKLMSEEFVLGRSIDEALKRGKALRKSGYTFSFDMLGEAALTEADASRYFAAYADAIERLARHVNEDETIFQHPGISVKLSALYPRYEFLQHQQAIPALATSLKQLALRARDLNIALTVDAEEADRLDMSLQVFAKVFADPDLANWSGLGLAVQAYQKRAPAVLDWIDALSRRVGKKIQVRLVKGAYWDTEIKHAQMEGWESYPVFTRKDSTDISYLACAKKMLAYSDTIYPKFATHNAYTVAAILSMLEPNPGPGRLEFQNLQGMGKALHQQILARGITCRVYAPVGSYTELLPYLVRRLLENGANTSFVNQVVDKSVSIEELIKNPVVQLAQRAGSFENPYIPSPRTLFADRVNSRGINYTNQAELTALQASMRSYQTHAYTAAPSLPGIQTAELASRAVVNPGDHTDTVGQVHFANEAAVDDSVAMAAAYANTWAARDVDERAALLEAIANALESAYPELIMLLCREAGKVLVDAINECREAVDFCRYYAVQARTQLADQVLPGYTGESNVLRLGGRGVIACISPWNFPVAIFIGQIVAALVTGNTVVAKPAEQTSCIATRVVALMQEAGLPAEALLLLPGSGSMVGERVVRHPQIAGVMFTGSTATAKRIQLALAEKPGPIVPLIAETGGMNAMIVDSSALPEQVIADVVDSAFGSAGQRCSALRVLFVQEDVADRMITMLQGAMATLTVGAPDQCHTDVGPVIDAAALARLQQHRAWLNEHGTVLSEVAPSAEADGHYFAPCAYELRDAKLLTEEVFGPILHVVRFKRKQLADVIDTINGYGYGLTFGVHSRIVSEVDHITRRVQCGNVYVNRNTVGAVVGVQPFGGCGLSGTGPKAGGPHYLLRLCQEVVVSEDTTASGGNASLMTLELD